MEEMRRVVSAMKQSVHGERLGRLEGGYPILHYDTETLRWTKRLGKRRQPRLTSL